jgi:predicted kinase
LTSVEATTAPLVVLGQPGAGKSLLTKVLAARLPAADFLPVRVALREVPAEAEVQDQIDYAIRAATGERVEWPDLSRSAGGAMPVVLLDGFDELLQATGVSQPKPAEGGAVPATRGRPRPAGGGPGHDENRGRGPRPLPLDRKTARRYVAAAEQAGVVRDGGEAQLTDEVVGQVVQAVRPARATGRGASWEALEAEAERIAGWPAGSPRPAPPPARHPDHPGRPRRQRDAIFGTHHSSPAVASGFHNESV